MKSLSFLLLACSSSTVFSAIVRMDVGFEVDSTNLTAYPGTGVQMGDPVLFSITYDSDATPTSYFPSSLDPSEVIYNLQGSAVVTIGSYTWATESFEFVIWDNPDVLTPTDQLTFRGTMTSSPLLGSGSADVVFNFGSLPSDLTFTSSFSLPSFTSDLNFDALENSYFAVGQPSGETPVWSIDGLDYTSFSITTIPEPSSAVFCLISMLGLMRRSRP